MALPELLTVADLYAMPEGERGERYELIEGELFVTPLPTRRHQLVLSNLFYVLSAHVRASRLGWILDNVGVYLDEQTYLVPDLAFISRERRGAMGTRGVEAVPDLVCEILSPSTRRRDLVTKRALYARAGVREYWLTDPLAQSLTVLILESGGFVELRPGDDGVVVSRALPGIRPTLADVFEDTEPTAE